MTTGNSDGYIAFEKMLHYAISSKMYDVQPSHFVFAMETFLLFWLMGFLIYPAAKRKFINILNYLNKYTSFISRRDNLYRLFASRRFSRAERLSKGNKGK